MKRDAASETDARAPPQEKGENAEEVRVIENADAVRVAQIEGNIYFTETLEILRDRGWIKPQFDLLTVTYMIHGILFGHVLLDFSRLPELEEGWGDVAISTIIYLVGGSEKFAPLAKAAKPK